MALAPLDVVAVAPDQKGNKMNWYYTQAQEKPIRVDVEKIAAGLLDMFDEDDAGPLAFGMLPAKKMEIFERGLSEKFDCLCSVWFGGTAETMRGLEDEHGITEFMRGDAFSDDIKAARKRFVSEISHAVAVEIYRQTSEAGRMVV